MIVETSAFFQKPYERADHPAIKDVMWVAGQYKDKPVRVWVGQGFFQFVKDEIYSKQSSLQLIGILSGAAGDYLILDPWFDEQALYEAQFKKILNWMNGENTGNFFGRSLRELGIAISKFGLAIPVSEITMLGRNPDMMDKSELDRPVR